MNVAETSTFAVFLKFMEDGGPVNWVILVLYLFTLAVCSQRIVFFLLTRCKRERFFAIFGAGDFESAQKILKRHEKRSQIYRIGEVFYQNAAGTEAVLQENLDRGGALLKQEMRRGLVCFSFTAAVAPLLGLLGTITGLMKAFSEIEGRGNTVDISFLAGGIREAMITTASGLVVAISALSCGKLFEYITDRRLDDMSLIISLFTEKRAGGRGQV